MKSYKLFSSKKIVWLSVFMSLFLFTEISAATWNSNVTTSGSWGTAASWSPASVPNLGAGANNTANIVSGDSITVGTLTIGFDGNVVVQNGGILRITGNLQMDGNAEITVESGGVLIVDGVVKGGAGNALTESGTKITVDAGGTATFNSTISLGSASIASFSGDVTINASLYSEGSGTKVNIPAGTTTVTGTTTLKGDASSLWTGNVTTNNLNVNGSGGLVTASPNVTTVTNLLTIFNDGTVTGSGIVGWGTSNMNSGCSGWGFIRCSGGSMSTFDNNACNDPGRPNPIANPINLATCSAACSALVPGIIADAQTICNGADVAAFTSSTPASGGDGSTYDYQWQSSITSNAAGFTDIGGANSATYDHGVLATTTWFKRAVTSSTCGTEYSNVLEITVYPTSVVGSIGTAQTIDRGDTPAPLTNLVSASGGGGFTYQWQISTTSGVAGFTDIGGATSAAYTPPSGITNDTWYRRAAISTTGCGTLYTTSIKITVEVRVDCGVAPPAIQSVNLPAGGTGSYTYTWQSSPDNSTWTNIASSDSIGLIPSAIQTNTYYRRGVSSGVCDTVYTTSVLAQFTASASTTSDVIDSPYVSSSGDTIFDKSTYSNDIIGIGRECALLRKQSPSTDDSVRIFISTYAASNAANAGTITNSVSYVMIGHDDGKLKATAAAGTEKPGGIVSRLEREWKVTNTNFDDSYSIEIEWDSIGAVALADLRLLVDDDGDFSDAQVFNAGDNGLTFAFGSIIIGGIGVAHIPAGATKFITLGSVSAATPLPVELISFNASKRNDITIVSWTTASEINNDYFKVEKSTDGVNWYSIGQITGAGNSQTPLYYSYVDNEGCNVGTCYYRLVQVDYDKKTTFSEVKSVINETTTVVAVKVYPNPTKNGLNVSFVNDAFETVVLNVYDARGKEAYRANVVCTEGKNDFKLNIDNLSPGIYYLKIVDVNGMNKGSTKFNKL